MVAELAAGSGGIAAGGGGAFAGGNVGNVFGGESFAGASVPAASSGGLNLAASDFSEVDTASGSGFGEGFGNLAKKYYANTQGVPAQVAELQNIMNNIIAIKQINEMKRRVDGLARYSTDILNFNTGLDLEALSRGVRSLRSTQTAQSAGTGFSTTSGSFLAIANQTISRAELEVIDRRIATRNQTRMIEYRRQLAQEQLSDARRNAQIGIGGSTFKLALSAFSMGGG